MTELVDPTAAFLEQDPTVLREEGLALPVPPAPRNAREHLAWEIGAGLIVTGMLVRRHLRAQQPDLGRTGIQARSAWEIFAPTWMRLVAPAVAQAYALGRTDAVTPEELQHLAGDYARGIGDYFAESSAEALTEGFEAQLAQRWDPSLAWYRSVEAYGLDRRAMRGYVSMLVRGQGEDAGDPMPKAARLLVDRAFLARTTLLGEEEAWSAEQAGQAIVWLYLERKGELAPGHTRGWILGATERHCDTCLQLAGQLVPLAEPFRLLDGTRVWAPRAHPKCDCRLKLVRPGEEISKADSITVAGIALRARDTGRVLMLQRAQDGKDPGGGMWEFPGGHLERGETPWQGACREWEEEVRRRFPGPDPTGAWTSGIYAGFISEVPTEGTVPTHTRGRIVNPDDPDGDAVEALAWWDLDHLASNPAVRPEVRRSVADIRRAAGAVSKAQGSDRFDRDNHGRFALVEERTADKQAGTFGGASSPFAPSSPFKASAPFHGRPWGERSPFAANSPFKAAAGRSAFAAKPRPKPVVHGKVIILPRPPGSPRPEPDSTYFLAADSYHALMDEAARGAHYDLGDVVDFDQAASRPRAESGVSPWNLIRDRDVLVPPRVSMYVDRDQVERHWGAILPSAVNLWHQALDLAGDPESGFVDRLEDHDVRRVLDLAGYDPSENPNLGRARIVDAVHNRGNQPDDSLANAFADYVVWHEPTKFFGADGRWLDEKLDDAESDGISVRDAVEHPLPIEQVFAFSGQLHPGTEHDADVAHVQGGYAAAHHFYRSAIADTGLGTPPLRFGLRETYMAPFNYSGKGHWEPPASWGAPPG